MPTRHRIETACLLCALTTAYVLVPAVHAAGTTITFMDSGANLSSGGNCMSIALGDVDGDGDLDAFIAQFDRASRLWINDGSGQYAMSSQTFGGASTHGSAFGDLDGDGDLDLFIVFNGAQHRVYRNNGNGIFTDTAQRIGSAADNGVQVRLGDLDGDGDLDALVDNYAAANKVFMNDGSGNFGSAVYFENFEQGVAALGDLDGDGDLDVFMVRYGASDDIVWLNDGTGDFVDSGQRLGEPAGWGYVEMADLDGDSDLDAFVTNNSVGSIVHLNNGSGVFMAAGAVFGSSSQSLALCDLDRDGDVDAVTTHSTNDNSVWVNDGSGAFASAGALLGAYGARVRFGDADGDGDLDAFVSFGPLGGSAVKLYFNETEVAVRPETWGTIKNRFMR